MAYEYQPKFPRRKLHEIVTRYVSRMQVMGRAPNCGVVFDDGRSSGDRPDTLGWLLDAEQVIGSPDRFLLLHDGDVWHEAAVAASDSASAGWLPGPTDDLAVVLAKSLCSAQFGGTGYLTQQEPAGDPRVVPDRREAFRPHQGPERRRPD